jgi:hypothetical protein
MGRKQNKTKQNKTKSTKSRNLIKKMLLTVTNMQNLLTYITQITQYDIFHPNFFFHSHFCVQIFLSSVCNFIAGQIIQI